jgi:hypothetical protein
LDDNESLEFIKWKQRDKNQPKSPVKNQPPLMTDIPVRVRFKPDSKGRVSGLSKCLAKFLVCADDHFFR